MKFKTTQSGPVTVIQLQGNLMGGPDASTLNNKLHELVEAGKKHVVIDLHGVQFMNSSGLGLLIGGASTMKNAGGIAQAGKCLREDHGAHQDHQALRPLRELPVRGSRRGERQEVMSLS